MSIFKFNLGDEVRDLVTGIVGVVVAKTEWLNGCKRYTIEREAKKDGTLPESVSADEQQLELKKALKVKVGQPLNGEPPKEFTGGPRPTPTRARSTPKAVGR
jgi:hypothetical protein